MHTRFAALLAVLAASSLAAADLNLAVVDMEQLVQRHPNTASDKKLLEQTLQEYSEQKETLQSLAETARKAYEAAAKEAQNPALSDKAKQRQEEDAQRKREAAVRADREYSETVRNLQRQLTDQEMRMLKRTYAEIQGVIAAHAKENGLSLVMELPGRKLGNASGVVYSEASLDITTAILTRMGISPEAPAADEDEAAPAIGAKRAPGAKPSAAPAAPPAAAAPEAQP